MFVISPAEGLGAGDDVVVIYSARTETNCVTLKNGNSKTARCAFWGALRQTKPVLEGIVLINHIQSV